MGRAMGMVVIYGLAEFTIPNMQMLFERAGFQIAGIVPASDRLMVAPGVIKLLSNLYQSAGRRRRCSSPAIRKYDAENQGALRSLVRKVRLE